MRRSLGVKVSADKIPNMYLDTSAFFYRVQYILAFCVRDAIVC